MRTGPAFNATATTAAATLVSTPSTSGLHSAWHSPIPYLFGGLAAMIGLIAFALLILACSYWKLSGYLEGSNNRDNGDSSSASEKPAQLPVAATMCYDEKIVVIMAGDENPTFLATPVSSRSSSFNDEVICTDGNNDKRKDVEMSVKVSETRKQESSDRENQSEDV
ncbi:hypothetical protein LUZ60_002865 [Juncus effusus]|nr:hypothetical protein LUZ60_002865 [Juncus effusus]